MVKRDAGRTTDTDTEVLEVAVELHAQDEARRDVAREQDAVREAAVELGVEGHLEAAAAEVARRREEAEARKAKRTRWARRLAGFVVAIAAGFALYQVSKPTPPTPWTLVAARAAWVLDTSAGTVASSRFDMVEGRDIAAVTVVKATPRADGTWFVNLDRTDVPAFDGHQSLVVRLSGDLPFARVYLEAGTDERWRSMPVPVQPDWTDHLLPLASFERQERVGENKWRVVEWRAPRSVTTLSVKLGHFVNSPDSTGTVRVGEIRVE